MIAEELIADEVAEEITMSKSWPMCCRQKMAPVMDEDFVVGAKCKTCDMTLVDGSAINFKSFGIHHSMFQ